MVLAEFTLVSGTVIGRTVRTGRVPLRIGRTGNLIDLAGDQPYESPNVPNSTPQVRRHPGGVRSKTPTGSASVDPRCEANPEEIIVDAPVCAAPFGW